MYDVIPGGIPEITIAPNPAYDKATSLKGKFVMLVLCVLQLHAACRHFILLLNFLPYRDETIISLHPGRSSKKTGSTQHLGPLHNILCVDMYNNDHYTFAADFGK